MNKKLKEEYAKFQEWEKKDKDKKLLKHIAKIKKQIK